MREDQWIRDGGFKMFPKTKERLLEICDDILAISDLVLMANYLKRKGIKGKFNPVKWDDYIVAISLVKPCQICFGPKVLRDGIRYVCRGNPFHTSAWDGAMMSNEKNHAGDLEEGKLLEIAKNSLCEHDKPFPMCENGCNNSEAKDAT